MEKKRERKRLLRGFEDINPAGANALKSLLSKQDEIEHKSISPRPLRLGKVEILTNYTKFDNDVLDIFAREQTPVEQAIYHQFYRLSYGTGRNYCQVGMGALAKACKIRSSAKTVKKAIANLLKKGHLTLLAPAGLDKKGSVYRVNLPCELPGIISDTKIEITEE